VNGHGGRVDAVRNRSRHDRGAYRPAVSFRLPRGDGMVPSDRGCSAPARRGRGRLATVLFTTGLRDFAVAAALAEAAVGPAVAGVAGAYGLLMLLAGAAAAGRLRS